MAECFKCKSSKVRKHGFGRYQAQRFFCGDCHTSFTPQGKRGTYAPEFKQKVIEKYCHSNAKAQEVIEDFGISSRTLIQWKKEHQKICGCGK